MISRATLYRLSPMAYVLADRLYRGSPLARRRQKQSVQAQRQRMKRYGERAEKIVSEYLDGDYRVRHGLFSGMTLTADSEGSPMLPRLVGSYEQPIHEALASAMGFYDTIINVGSSEGYFAVGFALKTRAKVYAFDIQTSCQQACRVLAEANGVGSHVVIGGLCGWDDIARLVTPKTLLFCDIDGGEAVFLDPARCPALASIDIIVETHETFAPGCIKLLSARFCKTHRIVEYHDYPRQIADFSCLAAMPQEIAEEAINEWRPIGQTWLFMTALQPKRD